MTMNGLKVVLFALLGAARTAGALDTNQPLPSLEQVFDRVVTRARVERENDRSFNTQFFYVKSRTTEYRNGKGELRKQEVKTSTNNPILLREALAASPVPTKRLPKPEGKPQAVSETHSNVRGKAFETEEFLVNRDLVRRFEFTLVGREDLNGRSALVVEFRPAQGRLPERDLKDRFINKAAGRVWIDEGDYALAKAALHLTEHVNVLGGLVGAVRKFTFDFEREHVADTLWFTRLTTWHLEGREVFVSRVVDFREERKVLEKAR